MEAVQAFEELRSAWHSNDTNQVVRLCVSSYNPYGSENYPKMNFAMTHQSEVGKVSFRRVGGDPELYRLQPNAYRSWYSFFTSPQYLLGQVFFFTKEDGVWKYTGQTDYHLD